MARTAKITSKGQITVPNEVRRALGVRPGDRLGFEERGGEMRVVRHALKAPLHIIAALAIRRSVPAGRPL